ncbi:MAG: hypothetical protein DRI34_06975 [Deltaproteobacteria bacterium]|nr:MAG: hypothetical protein DRI34_06975 [Deltaproteobacteria bacterium]
MSGKTTGCRWLLLLPALLLAWLAVAAGPAAPATRKAARQGPVRSGPAAYYPLVDRLQPGERVTVLEKKPRWLKVRTPRARQGWVSVKLFTAPAPARGYQKLLRDRGLEGTSVSVVTLAGRGLDSGAGGVPAAGGLVREWLVQGGFRPEGLGDFLERLKPRSCPRALQALGAPRQWASSQEAFEAERRLGEAAALRLLGGRKVITRPELDDYLNKVGTAVAVASERYDVPWRFVLFEQGQPRLLALPGGVVLLSTGLLGRLEDEAELAGLLAHAVARVVLDQGVKELEGRLPAQGAGLEQAAGLVLEIAGRAGRREDVDRLAAALCACAGYDPRGLVRVIERLPELWGQEPGEARARARRLERRIEKAGLRGGAVLRERFLVKAR